MSLEDCEKRGAVLDGKKCFCTPWNCWTNCLEVGHCVYEKHRKPKQGTLFDESEIEE
jgi:hypothetical protein